MMRNSLAQGVEGLHECQHFREVLSRERDTHHASPHRLLQKRTASKFGDDAELGTCAPHCPEQIPVFAALVIGNFDDPSVREDHLNAQQVVNRESMLGAQYPDAASQNEAAD